jgi:hypothetical protein
VVRYGFFAAEKDDDAALDSRVESMCREIGSRAKNDESGPVLPQGVRNERPVSASAPLTSASDAAPQVLVSTPASATGPATVLPASQSAQSLSAAGAATLPTSPIDMVATMREIQALFHAEADRAQAQAEARQTACAPKPIFSDDQTRALQVL